MKKIILGMLCIAMYSCTTMKNIDTTGYSILNKNIIFQQDTVARLSNIEYSLDNGKFVKEMTFKLTDMKHGDKVKNIIYFMHKEHKGWDIEIDYPIDNVIIK